jgi:diguanylate cyclase (GGDEF)-like protein
MMRIKGGAPRRRGATAVMGEGSQEGSEFELRAYERLADLFARLLAEEQLDSLLEGVADAVEELIPCTGLVLFEFDEAAERLVPIVARGRIAGFVRDLRPAIGEGLAGRSVETREPLLANAAATDERAAHVPGTPEGDIEAIIAAPLMAHGRATGCLSIYREGEGNVFTENEFRFASRFAHAAAIALENARARARLAQLAQTDDLTGTLNRRGFFEAVDRELARAARDDRPTALLLVDVDQLKSVNDRYGHASGDLLLRRVADALKGRTRRGDVIGRLGGDEFAVVLSGAGQESAERLALEIETMVHSATIDTPEGVVEPAVSVGVAATLSVGTDAAQLLSIADADMYRRKQQKREEQPAEVTS